MDSANLRNMRRIVGGDSEKKMFLLLDFAGEKGDIADPWYTGNFEDTYRDVRRGCEGLLEHLLKEEEVWNELHDHWTESKSSHRTGRNRKEDTGFHDADADGIWGHRRRRQFCVLGASDERGSNRCKRRVLRALFFFNQISIISLILHKLVDTNHLPCYPLVNRA